MTKPFKLPNSADEFVEFMNRAWSDDRRQQLSAREVANQIGAKELYHDVGGKSLIYELQNGDRVVIRNDGKAIRKRFRRGQTYTGPETLKRKGGAKKLLRTKLKYLVALIDANVPAEPLLAACDEVYKAIGRVKQVEVKNAKRKLYPHTNAVWRRKRMAHNYRFAEFDQPCHEQKYLRECKRLDVDPE